PNIEPGFIARFFEGRSVAPVLLRGRAPEAVGASDAAIVCSGTATLEAALMLRPFVVVYRVSWLNALVFRLFVRVAHVALVNLLANRRLVPELLQHEFTPERVADTVARYLEEPRAREELTGGLAEVRRSLGEPGASRRAADAVEAVLGRIAAQPPRVVDVARTA
ncbi:MAG: lipid-A-disaccharide synthase, partial [Myxococcales bacterium]